MCKQPIFNLICFIVILHTSQSHNVLNRNSKANLENTNDCGLPNDRITKIPKGGNTPILPISFPWVAAIGTAQNHLFIIHCTGVLISSRHVLTRASCVHKADNPSHVRFGEYDFLSESPLDHTRDEGIYEISIHPGFINDTHEDNLAIITLYREVKFNDYIRNACLPSPTMADYIFDENFLFVVGYNVHDELRPMGINAEAFARGENLYVMSQEDCLSEHSDSDLSITNKNICTNDNYGQKCAGKFDGPLHYYDTSEKKYIVMGMLSKGSQCVRNLQSSKIKPSIFTSIPKYLKWINDEIRK